MNPGMIAGITVFVRIGLYALTGALLTKGWIDGMTADEIRSPITIEVLAGMGTALLSGIWYWRSEARKALKDRFSE
jgi:hypothetical protein